MQWSTISFAPSARLLRQFAGLWVVFFSGLACWQYFAKENPPLALGMAAATVIGWAGLVQPQSIRYVWVAWMVLAFPIGWAVSHFILAIIFYGLFTPLGCIFRLVGRDPLALRARCEVGSYWQDKPAPAGVKSYFHQY